jgi:hypothetical protein
VVRTHARRADTSERQVFLRVLQQDVVDGDTAALGVVEHEGYARSIFTGKQDTVKPVDGNCSRLCSFSM